MQYKSAVLLLSSLLLAGCNVAIQTDLPTATPPILVTATLPSSPTPRPSETPLPPPPTPTVAPVPGTTSTQLNVRAEPSTASPVLGIIAANQTILITGQDPGGNWWQIIYEAGADGKGWITAQYVETATQPEVPVIGGGEASADLANSAVIIQQLNIRSGPGTGFNSLGILNPNDVVSLTARNRDGSWVQIQFADGPDGTGWISAAFVRSDGLETLPIVTDSGEVVGTGTPVDTPPPPTPTIVPAPLDFDSADAPLKTILLDRAGTQTLIYNGDVSSPTGDEEDWIGFTPSDDFVVGSLECRGNGSLRVEIVGTGVDISCNESEKVIPVKAGMMQLVHIEAVPASSTLQYTSYILTISASR